MENTNTGFTEGSAYHSGEGNIPSDWEPSSTHVYTIPYTPIPVGATSAKDQLAKEILETYEKLIQEKVDQHKRISLDDLFPVEINVSAEKFYTLMSILDGEGYYVTSTYAYYYPEPTMIQRVKRMYAANKIKFYLVK